MRRFGLACLIWLFSLPALANTAVQAGQASQEDEAVWRMLRNGGVLLLMRHAQTVPGTGDPAGFRLDDCATQRNLSEEGRAQARRTGEAFRQRGIALKEVRTSAWCRCVDTAQLAFGKSQVWLALNSFFNSSSDGSGQTAEVLAAVSEVKAPHNWMLVTHQVNITALTGEWPSSGEILVARPPGRPGEKLQVIGRLRVP